MKTSSRLSLAALLSIFFITLLYSSCQKEIDKRADQQLLKIYLTDDPVPFDAVFVDIQRIEVLVLSDSCRSSREDEDDDDDDGDDDHDGDDDDDGDDDHNGDDGDDCDDSDDHERNCAVWDTLDIRAGVYNLLNFSNGIDTLLATGYTPAGKILKIRITLGNSNSVMIDSVSYPLQLYRNTHQVIVCVRHDDDVEQISPGNLRMFLDFDASRSIIRIDNNRFVLRPRIGLFVPSRTASIEGRVIPERAKAVVAAYASGDTLVAIPDNDGEFKIRGLRGNSADLFINATANGYRDTIITGIAIRPGQEKNIGTISLRQ